MRALFKLYLIQILDRCTAMAVVCLSYNMILGCQPLACQLLLADPPCFKTSSLWRMLDGGRWRSGCASMVPLLALQEISVFNNIVTSVFSLHLVPLYCVVPYSFKTSSPYWVGGSNRVCTATRGGGSNIVSILNRVGKYVVWLCWLWWFVACSFSSISLMSCALYIWYWPTCKIRSWP